jgi:Flp pilus assembly protein TadD
MKHAVALTHTPFFPYLLPGIPPFIDSRFMLSQMAVSNKLFILKTSGFLILAAVTLGVYVHALSAPFVLDDLRVVAREPKIRDISNFLQWKAIFGPRPLVNLSFAINYRWAGLDVEMYHATNLLIHAANIFLLYMMAGLAFAFCGKESSADAETKCQSFLFSFSAAALFALHPIQSQPVIYISQRATLMACFFYLLSVICYMLARRAQVDGQKRGRQLLFFALCAVTGIMAFLSKENTASLPLAILLVEMICFDASWDGWKKKLPMIIGLVAVLVLGFAWITGAFHGELSDFLQRIDRLTRETTEVSRWQYFCTQLTVVLLYLRLTFLPSGFSIDHDYPMKHGFFEDFTPIAFLLLAGIVIMALAYRKKYKMMSFGILWFFIALSVESSVIPIRDAMFEHRMYLAFPGISLITADLLTRIPLKMVYKTGVAAAVLVACVLTTFTRTQAWRSELSLWQDAAAKAPHNARAWNNYGNALASGGQQDLAAEAFQRAIRVNPEYARPYCNLGKLYAEKGDLTKSEILFLKSIELDPHFAEPHNNLAINYAARGNLEKGIRHFQRSLEINPNIPYTHYNLGKAYLDAGKPQKALDHLLQTISLVSDINPMAYYLAAAAYAAMNQPENSVSLAKEAIQRGLGSVIDNIKMDPRFAPCRETVLRNLLTD